MPVTGKMTVDLYANSDPFVQGMKAAADAEHAAAAADMGGNVYIPPLATQEIEIRAR